MGAALERYGEWAESEIFLLSRFIRPGDVVVDAGAHVGTHALAFSNMVGKRGTVIAIDAQREVFELLCANLVLNGADNVMCYQALVGAELGTRFIAPPAVDRAENYAAVSFAGIAPRAPGSHPALVLPIDALTLEACRVMKFDVEQMEAEALRGAAQTLGRLRPLLYYEQTTEAGFGAVQELLTELGYRCFWHRAPAYNRNNFKENPHNMFGSAADLNIVAVPSSENVALLPESCRFFEVRSSEFAPPTEAEGAWALPDDAYAFYPDRRSAPRPKAGAEQRLQACREELATVRSAFASLIDDRAKAQQVMEAQHAELARLRAVVEKS